MFHALIRKRRSIREFREKPVEKEKIDLLVEAALRSPSSRSFNPWELVVVTDKAVLEKLSRSKPHGSSFLKDAALGIVVLGSSAKSDVWVEDCSIASIFIQLAAESMGLGSCWIQVRKRRHDASLSAGDYISGLLDIPPGLEVESIIAIGYAVEAKQPHKSEELQYEKAHLGSYKKAYHGPLKKG